MKAKARSKTTTKTNVSKAKDIAPKKTPKGGMKWAG